MKQYEILKTLIGAEKNHYQELCYKSDNPYFAVALAIYRFLEEYILFLEETIKDE